MHLVSQTQFNERHPTLPENTFPQNSQLGVATSEEGLDGLQNLNVQKSFGSVYQSLRLKPRTFKYLNDFFKINGYTTGSNINFYGPLVARWKY